MWDVFCRVIDNHGDLGVCLRLSRQLAAAGQTVRLWVDDPAALAWMAPDLMRGQMTGVQLMGWQQASDPDLLATLPPAKVWVEAFGCELPLSFVAHGVARAQTPGQSPPAWINLEYLSAEPWVERMHGLPSPVMSGPAAGWVKRFFYPGFTGRTGGLLREHDLLTQQASFDREAYRHFLLIQGGGTASHSPGASTSVLKPSLNTLCDAPRRLISLFCYEPAGLPSLLSDWQAGDHLLVTPGRAMEAVRAAERGTVQTTGVLGGHDLPPYALALPHTDQAGFDRLLWACDLNLVRGEDSLVRALWAGQPLVWNIYPQEDDAHHAKLDAFLDWLDAPHSLRHFSRVWNGIDSGPLAALCQTTLDEWGRCIRVARARLLGQRGLLDQLLDLALTSTAG